MANINFICNRITISNDCGNLILVERNTKKVHIEVAGDNRNTKTSEKSLLLLKLMKGGISFPHNLFPGISGSKDYKTNLK